MKTTLSILMVLLSFASFGQLTIDQKATISTSAVFQSRVQQILLEKAQYWTNTATSTRASVNVQLQKRKRFAKALLSDQNASANYKILAGNFWLTLTGSPNLDGGGIPTATAISDTFDATFDYLSGYKSGDESDTEIDW